MRLPAILSYPNTLMLCKFAWWFSTVTSASFPPFNIFPDARAYRGPRRHFQHSEPRQPEEEVLSEEDHLPQVQPRRTLLQQAHNQAVSAASPPLGATFFAFAFIKLAAVRNLAGIN
jgi:hypothetical protein